MLTLLFTLALLSHLLALGACSVSEREPQGVLFDERDLVGFSKRDTDTGPFDKGVNYQTFDGKVKIHIPPAHFCGNEIIPNVVEREDHSKRYSPTFEYYIRDLRNADPATRRDMVLLNLNASLADLAPAILNLFAQCQPPVDPDLNSPLGFDFRELWLLKTATSDRRIAYGVTLGYDPPPNGTIIFHVRRDSIIAIALYLVRVVFKLNREWLYAEPYYLKKLDEYTAAAITGLGAAFYPLAQWLSQVIYLTPGYYKEFGQDPRKSSPQQVGFTDFCTTALSYERNEALLLLPTIAGGDFTQLRPLWSKDAIYNAANKDACPPDPLVAGSSGSVAG